MAAAVVAVIEVVKLVVKLVVDVAPSEQVARAGVDEAWELVDEHEWVRLVGGAQGTDEAHWPLGARLGSGCWICTAVGVSAKPTGWAQAAGCGHAMAIGTAWARA